MEAKKPAALYRRANYVSERKVGKTTYLVDKRRNTIHQLNPIGAAVWSLLDDPKDIEALVRILHSAFDNVRYGVIQRDIEKLIDGLLKAELIAQSSARDGESKPSAERQSEEPERPL